MLTKQGQKVDWANLPLKDCIDGNIKDAYFTLKIFEVQEKLLAKKGLTELYEQVVMPAAIEFIEIEYNGLHIGKEKLDSVGSYLEGRLNQFEKFVLSLPNTPEDINLGSPKELGEFIFSEKGLNLPKIKESDKTGAPSTDIETIETLLSLIGEALHE